MALALVMPDIVKLMVAFLRAQAEVTALTGNPLSIRGKLARNTVFPAVAITRITDEPVQERPFYIEAVRVQFDCWGGNNRQAERLAQAVRSSIMERALNHGNSEGFITKLVPRGMSDTPDDLFDPNKERYIVEIEIWVRPIPA